MELRASRDVQDREVSRVVVGIQEKRVNLEKLASMESTEKRAKVEWLDPQETEEILEEQVPKEPKDKQETKAKWESEETQVQLEKITTAQDLKETLVMLDHRESLVMMERWEQRVNLEEGDLMAEEAHLDRLEIPESQELMVLLERLVSEDLEVHLDRLVHQEAEEKMETLDPEVPEDSQVPLERRAGEELLVARESQESQDRRVLLDLLVLVESLVKMAEMASALKGLTEERVMKASQDSQDRRELLATPALRADLDPEEIVDRGVSLGMLVHPDRRERLDIPGHMVRKDREDQASCNVTWSRKSGTTALAVLVSRNVRSTPPSWPSPWMSLRPTDAHPSTTCVTQSNASSKTSPSLRATVQGELVLL